MTDSKTLYTALLGVTEPWGVELVEMKREAGEVHVTVALPKNTRWVCPECLAAAPIHDHQERSWRHLDTCQFKTFVHARVPRLNCPTHGIKQIQVLWAEPGSRFTALFEALAIDWLKQSSMSAVAKQMRISWDEANGIMARAVARGLARRQPEALRYVGVDETSFQKRHEYVTVVSNLEGTQVLYVGDDRKRESLDGFWVGLTPEQRNQIEAVAMDMWEPYIQSTHQYLPDAASKIVFDKFHVAMHLNKAVDLVRRQEHRELMAEGQTWLKGTKYDWLRNPANFSLKATRAFHRLRLKVNKVARAWSMKETAMYLWDLQYPAVAERHFREWYRWARRGHLEPMKKVAVMLKRHWDNIKTFFKHRITNAGAESVNEKIQTVKRRARGFRNRERFRNAIYFHCGGLDLYPARARFAS
jgi:transposase